MRKTFVLLSLTTVMLTACHASPSSNLGSSPTAIQNQFSTQGLTNLKVADMGYQGGSSFGLRFDNPQDLLKAASKYGVQSLSEDVADQIKWFVITLARTPHDVTNPGNASDNIANHRGQQLLITRGRDGFTNCGGYFTNVQPGDYFLQIAAIVPSEPSPDDVNKGFNVARSLEISDLGACISNVSVPTDGNQDFITVKFRVNPPPPKAADPTKYFIRACLGLQKKLVEEARGLDWDVFGVSIATGNAPAQVWENSQQGLMTGHIATYSSDPTPTTSPIPCPSGNCKDED